MERQDQVTEQNSAPAVERPEVTIIGAGPAGMFLAYLLVTNGIAVRVLERHPDFSREFRGEGIQPSVMKALQELGFLDHLVEQGIAVPAHRAKIFMDDREVVTLDGLEAEMDDFGLIVDLYLRWTGRELARPGSARPIFWLMTFGAFGAVLGPWLAVNAITALGIVIHQVATVWLLVNMILPLRGTSIARTPGIWHVITAYVWQVAVVLGAPLIALLYPGFSPAAVEQTAPQVLIYGWMLQFGYAMILYVLRRAAAPNQEAALGGSWFSLGLAHVGGVFLLASILSQASATPCLGLPTCCGLSPCCRLLTSPGGS